MERERSQRLIDGDRMSGEITMLNEKIRSLEEDIRIKISDFDASQVEIRSLRESNSNLDIQIQSLQSQLSDASLYKEWYESKQREYDDLYKQFDEEQRKVYAKDDEIMQLQDKLTTEQEAGAELREEIKKLNERISELENDLANRQVKDDSSSSSSEKEDHSKDVEEWKKKYEKIKSEFERYERTTTSEIEELKISIKNLEKRNVELKMLLDSN